MPKKKLWKEIKSEPHDGTAVTDEHKQRLVNEVAEVALKTKDRVCTISTGDTIVVASYDDECEWVHVYEAKILRTHTYDPIGERAYNKKHRKG